ncbi:hypothetical protein [Rhodococcus koreensis]|uniref:hypothetical protein n=1 Tax=Rhodococcus koreensis TaxID=99653 RepID=UPI00366BD58B
MDDGFCDVMSTYECVPDNDIYFYMQACRDGYMLPNDVVLAMKPVVAEANGRPIIKLTCSGYQHLSANHNADVDQDRFAMCLALTYNLGSPWTGADPPNIGIDWRNPNNDHHGYISYSPLFPNEITTAFPLRT